MLRTLILASCLQFAPVLAAASFKTGMKFQIVLSSVIDTTKPLTPDAPVFDIDMEGTPAATIATLKAKGKTTICYFSAGTHEDWRSDAKSWDPSDYGNQLADWPGERWANINSQGVRNIMEERIKRAAEKGCDALDPDNIGTSTRHADIHRNYTDFDVTDVYVSMPLV